MEKKEKAVVLGLTNNMTFAVASVLLDIKMHNPLLADEVVILHDGLIPSEMEMLSSILPIRYIEYELPFKFKDESDLTTISYFSKMVFSKFECLKLLDEYKSVMWLDYDIVLLDDISELFTPSTSGIKMMPSGFKVSRQFHHPIKEYDMNVEGICGSTFVFHDFLPRYLDMYNYCYDKLLEYGENLFLGEQGIFDCMIQEYGLKVEPISRYIYSPHPNDNYETGTKILHAYGRNKFWNGLNNDQWNKNYEQWLIMGGKKYQAPSFKGKLRKKIKAIIGL